MTSNVILQAIRDVRARQQLRSPLVISLRVSNITMWRREIADWIKTSEDHILLLQETHLGPTQAREAAQFMHRQGYQMYGGIAQPTEKGTKGGVSVLIKSHIQGRVELSHLEEGCGFEAVDVRLQHTNLLVVSVYLQTGTSIHHRPNSSILAELLSLVKNWKGVWIIAGDFNTPPEELAATNLLAEMNGCLCRVGVPTTDQGREIDYAIVHRALESLCQLRMEWAVPRKPHASLTLKLDLGEGLCPAMMLEPHSQLVEADHHTQGSSPEQGTKVLLDKSFDGEWLGAALPQDETTQLFAAVSHACSECVAPTCPSERGTSLKIIRKPLLQATAPQTKRSLFLSGPGSWWPGPGGPVPWPGPGPGAPVFAVARRPRSRPKSMVWWPGGPVPAPARSGGGPVPVPVPARSRWPGPSPNKADHLCSVASFKQSLPGIWWFYAVLQTIGERQTILRSRNHYRTKTGAKRLPKPTA